MLLEGSSEKAAGGMKRPSEGRVARQLAGGASGEAALASCCRSTTEGTDAVCAGADIAEKVNAITAAERRRSMGGPLKVTLSTLQDYRWRARRSVSRLMRSPSAFPYPSRRTSPLTTRASIRLRQTPFPPALNFGSPRPKIYASKCTFWAKLPNLGRLAAFLVRMRPGRGTAGSSTRQWIGCANPLAWSE